MFGRYVNITYSVRYVQMILSGAPKSGAVRDSQTNSSNVSECIMMFFECTKLTELLNLQT